MLLWVVRFLCHQGYKNKPAQSKYCKSKRIHSSKPKPRNMQFGFRGVMCAQTHITQTTQTHFYKPSRSLSFPQDFNTHAGYHLGNAGSFLNINVDSFWGKNYFHQRFFARISKNILFKVFCNYPILAVVCLALLEFSIPFC